MSVTIGSPSYLGELTSASNGAQPAEALSSNGAGARLLDVEAGQCDEAGRRLLLELQGVTLLSPDGRSRLVEDLSLRVCLLSRQWLPRHRNFMSSQNSNVRLSISVMYSIKLCPKIMNNI